MPNVPSINEGIQIVTGQIRTKRGNSRNEAAVQLPDRRSYSQDQFSQFNLVSSSSDSAEMAASFFIRERPAIPNPRKAAPTGMATRRGTKARSRQHVGALQGLRRRRKIIGTMRRLERNHSEA